MKITNFKEEDLFCFKIFARVIYILHTLADRKNFRRGYYENLITILPVLSVFLRINWRILTSANFYLESDIAAKVNVNTKKKIFFYK